MSNKIPCGGFYLSDTLGVDENGKLGVNGGELYKSLVTDGEGGVKWEDRLAYETDPVLTEIVPEETVTFTNESGSMAASWPTTFNAVEGQTYIVKFDGADYTCTCIRLRGESGPLVLGNLSIPGFGNDTGEPFVMLYSEMWTIASSDSASEHTISISRFASVVKRIDHKFLPVATEDTYGVVKKSEIVISYNFPTVFAPFVEMIEAVKAFKAGNVKITWQGENVISARHKEADDSISLVFANNPYTVCVFSKSTSGESYIYNRTIHTDSNNSIAVRELYLVSDNGSRLGLTDKTLTLSSSTSGSTKEFRITVDDSGVISATEV